VDRRQDRGQATREQLVVEATRLFAERGFEATSVEAVLDAAGVSRGSLYHHFKSKDALFEAVLDAEEARIGEATMLAALGAGDDPVAQLRAGALEWIRLAGDPVVQRIVLIDAPAVLGWERWREIEEQNALGMLRAGLQSVADDARLDAGLVDPFAHMLLASINELALVVARAEDTGGAQDQASVAIDALLSRLLPTARS
jgi:AcrR family transcriptional regulator